MKEGPDNASVAALIGDPARANILTALMSGKALTASELAAEAGVTLPTASAHLSKLTDGALIAGRKQGRHKYFTIGSDQVADVLEALMGLAAGSDHLRTRTGPRDEALRNARICYDHLAGRMGIRMYRSMVHQGFLRDDAEFPEITTTGRKALTAMGIDLAPLETARRPLCRSCLDWSERRTHLAGSLGRAMLEWMQAGGWAARDANSRVIRFSPHGLARFESQFPSA